MFAQLLPLQERVAGLALFLGCFLVDKTDVRETTEGFSLQRCLYVQRRLTHEGIRSIEKQYLGSVMSNNTGSVILPRIWGIYQKTTQVLKLLKHELKSQLDGTELANDSRGLWLVVEFLPDRAGEERGFWKSRQAGCSGHIRKSRPMH